MANTFSHQILLKVLDMLNAIQKILHEKKKNNFITTHIAKHFNAPGPKTRGPILVNGWFWCGICFWYVLLFLIYIWANNSLFFLHKNTFFYLYPTFFIILKTPLKINCGVIFNKLFVSWRHSLNCRLIYID